MHFQLGAKKEHAFCSNKDQHIINLDKRPTTKFNVFPHHDKIFSIGIANVVSRSPRGKNFHDNLCEMLSRLHTSQYHWTGLKQPHLKLPLISLFSQKPFQISPLHHQFVFR